MTRSCRLAVQLKQAGARDLRLAMNRRLRAAARPVVADIRAAYLAVPDVSDARREGAQARATVAKAVRLEIRSSAARAHIRFVVDSRKLPPDMKPLPASWEKRRGWRHPVFADPGRTREDWVWVHQEIPARPFRPTIYRHADDFRRACLDAMADTAAQLNGRAGG